jgi:o-succinylbenzoate synthase
VKLLKIDVYRLSMRLRAPFTTSFGSYRELERPFVVIETEEGFRGVGEVPTLSDPAYKAEVDPPAVFASLEHFILPSVRRRQLEVGSVGTVEDLRMSYQWIKGAHFAKSAVEAAFWDIEAQRAVKPLWEFWGGTRNIFPVGVSIGGTTIDDVLARAASAVEMGFPRLKVKIWPDFDVEVVAALREAHPDIMLQVDANSAYTLDTWEALKELDQYDLLLIEQPLYDDDIVVHSEISCEISTPICLDESIHSLRDAKAAMHLWERNEKLDRLIVNIKPPRVSGFSEAIDIANACNDRGVKTWIGGMLDSGWGKAMNLNLNGLAAIDLPGDHFSPGGAYFEQDVIAQSLVARDGLYMLGANVSAGVEFDWEVFERLGQKLFSIDFQASA